VAEFLGKLFAWFGGAEPLTAATAPTVAAVKVDLLVVTDCPNQAVALARLRTALGALDLTDQPVSEIVINDPVRAAEFGMHGSPTVLIDGRDPFADHETVASVSCRLYRTADRVEGAPSVEALIAALDAARQRADDTRSGGLLTGDAGESAALGRDGFLALWRGERPRAADLSDADTIAALIAAGRLELDDDGRITGIHGLTIRPTRHRIDHQTGSINTWCALDAIGIPAALGIDATATTHCPTCETELTIQIRSGDADDTSTRRLWLPSAACDHLVDDFCRHANLYCTDEHLRAAVTAGTPGQVLTVGECAELGRAVGSDLRATRPSGGW
jgi:hypothetical protein